LAKAGSENITGILLSEAKALVTESYQAPHFAERLLMQWLAANKVRWRCSRLEGRRRLGPPPVVGDPSFWEEFDPPGSGGQVVLYVNWPESRAHRGGWGAYRIEVVKEDVVKMLLPLVPSNAGQERKPQDKPQVARARRAIDRLFPNGVPDTTSTVAIEMEIKADAEIVAELKTKKLPAPSWESVARALGRLE
jgi:hypothetical protein